MTQSRFYQKKATKHYSITQAADFCVSAEYAGNYELEAYIEKHLVKHESQEEGRQVFKVHGVEVVMVEAAHSHTKQAMVHITLSIAVSFDFAASDLAFRNVAGKMFPYSSDVSAVIDAYDGFLKGKNKESLHSSKTHKTPQNCRSGSAF